MIAGLWPGTASDLLVAAKQSELRAGRVPARRWGPRAADADILFFGDLVLQEPGLEIPHPGLVKRRFVLEPLAELAPDLVHPVSGLSIAELLERILESPR